MDIEKFTKWITDRGAEIIPTTNEYELLRFKAREVGVIYKSGKFSNNYTAHTIECFKHDKKWWGKPKTEDRKKSYKKEKAFIKNRDGDYCFYCGKWLNGTGTLEHLIPLSSGGKNTVSNMVLAHSDCNNEVGNLPLAEKVKIAIKKRAIIN